MSERIADNFSWSAILQLSKMELVGTSLIILSFALLPIGRVVEISTALMALSGLLLICKNQSRLALLNNQSARFFSVLFALIWLPMLISVIGTETLKNSAVFSFKYLRFFLCRAVYSSFIKIAQNPQFGIAWDQFYSGSLAFG